MCIALSASAQKELYQKLARSVADTNRVNLFQALGNYYQPHSNHSAANLDSSYFYFNRALQLSKHLKNTDMQMQSLSLLCKDDLEKKDFKSVQSRIDQILGYYRQTKNIKLQARYAGMLAQDMSFITTDVAPEYFKWCENAANLYGQAHDRIAQLSMMTLTSALEIRAGKLDEAEKKLLAIVKAYQEIHYTKLTGIYDMLANISLRQGDLNKELEYYLKLTDNLSDDDSPNDVSTYYYNLAQNYYLLGMNAQCVEWCQKGKKYCQAHGLDEVVYSFTHMIVMAMIKAKSPAGALNAIQQTVRESKPVSTSQKLTMYLDLGMSYQNLKNFEEAEVNYLKSDSLFNIRMASRDPANSAVNANNLIGHYITMASFYLSFNAFEKADHFVKKADLIPKAAIYPSTIRTLEYDQFKVDSAFGGYVKAIRHFQRYKAINDSLFNATKSKQLAEINVKYETSKKEQEIKLLQQHEQQAILQRGLDRAELQRMSLQRDVQAGQLRQADLAHNMQAVKLQKMAEQRKGEQQRAALLRKLQDTELKKVNTQRNVTFVGIALLLVISGLAYTGYQNKKRSNIMLQSKQAEINIQNGDLQKLLIEKDWLLKEVHHRVKNNLQIVMSLLSSQSAYLENNAAVEAIRESQSRVYAISLLHQKLYGGSNAASIDMPAYIDELIDYLADSFDARRHGVCFERLIEPVRLDLSQAVPLGLIINEAATNAIKYAFGPEGGKVVVGLQSLQDDNLILTIADNGIGLPCNFDLKVASSLGMEMMKALSKQMGGELTITNACGLAVHVEFQMECATQARHLV